MDQRSAMTALVLPATSVADDVGFVAPADVAELLGERPYRVIGGHMVTLLVARWGLGAELYRDRRHRPWSAAGRRERANVDRRAHPARLSEDRGQPVYQGGDRPAATGTRTRTCNQIRDDRRARAGLQVSPALTGSSAITW